jgi:hypothetical protein
MDMTLYERYFTDGPLSAERLRAGWLRACKAAFESSPKMREMGVGAPFVRAVVNRYGFTERELGL